MHAYIHAYAHVYLYIPVFTAPAKSTCGDAAARRTSRRIKHGMRMPHKLKSRNRAHRRFVLLGETEEGCPLYVCMQVCMYVCKYAYMHGWISVCLDVCIYVCIDFVLPALSANRKTHVRASCRLRMCVHFPIMCVRVSFLEMDF